jgi:heptosyltransferase-1
MPSADFRLLIVKTSSLGDVIHTLPVLEDLAQHRPDVSIDWLVEEAYAGLVGLSPRVQRIIEVADRRWRQDAASQVRQERLQFRARLRELPYDLVLDFQGLLKSAILAKEARLTPDGRRAGFSFRAAREPLARLFYQKGYDIDQKSHAVERLRSLAAQALGYRVAGLPRFLLQNEEPAFDWLTQSAYAVLLHATARSEKQWSEERFGDLALHLGERGLQVVLLFGSAKEEERARRIAIRSPKALVAPSLSLPEVARLLKAATIVIGVDTGLTHLASALDVPTVGLFGATPRWRYAPYWSERSLSLGDGVQPDLAEVVTACDGLLSRSAIGA